MLVPNHSLQVVNLRLGCDVLILYRKDFFIVQKSISKNQCNTMYLMNKNPLRADIKAKYSTNKNVQMQHPSLYLLQSSIA
jgi:hypothetical protein